MGNLSWSNQGLVNLFSSSCPAPQILLWEKTMTEECKHPNHHRRTAIATFISGGVGMLGAAIIALVQYRQDTPRIYIVGMYVGISLFGIGALAFIASTLWAGLVVRCPRCRRFIFRWGDSYPREKTFYCKQCDVNWNTGIVVGGPD